MTSRRLQLQRLRKDQCVSCGSGKMLKSGAWIYYPNQCRKCARREMNKKVRKRK